MKRKLTSIKTIPFQGGCNTAVEPALLDGKPSMVQNFRQKHPGYVKRAGQIKQHSTADGTNKVLSMYQFVKGKKTERHFYAQFSDDDVLEATTAPPGVTTGAFGSQVFAGAASSLPASWANVNDLLLFANGVDTLQIYPGTASPVEKFIVYKGAATIPTIPELGDDYTLEVTDGVTTTAAILDSLGTIAQFDCIFVMTPVPIDGLNFTIKAANGNAATASAFYWNGSAWTTVGSVADTTASAGKTFAVDGAWTWTLPTAHVPSYMYGVSGFWYQLGVSAALDSETEISAVTYESDWQSAQSIWDGAPVPIAESQIYDSSSTSYAIYGSSAIEIGNADSNGDLLYIAATDPISAIIIDVGDTPVVAGQDIATVKYWNGAWTAVTGLVDGTDGLTRSGWLTFARQSDVQKQRFNGSVYYAYWYQITIPQGNSAVCLNFNGSDTSTTFTDLSGKTWTAAGTAQLDIAQKQYGTASLLLDGNSDYITTPAHSDFNVGTGDFTIQFWIRPAAVTNNVEHGIFEIYTDAQNYFTLCFAADGSNLSRLDVLCKINNVNVIDYDATTTAPVNTWTHFALIRKNGVMQLFEDGAQITKDAVGCDGALYYAAGGTYEIGRSQNPDTAETNYTYGWIDDFQFVKAAIYEIDTNFTVPTEIALGVNSFLPAGMSVSVDVAPYFDIADMGKPQTVASWKNRLSMSTVVDHYTYLSAEGIPQSFNGDDAAILAPGDGRFNRPVAQRKLNDDLLIFQEEKGQEGGCVTKYTWVSTVNDIRKTIISTTLGTMNAKSVDIVDGVEFAELNRDQPVMSLAFFLSRYGVFVTDGSTVRMVSQDIANYFDPTQSACIRVGYEAQHWLKYDSAYGVIRIGLVSGSSATVPNVFPVLDVKDKTWSFDSLQQPLSCMTEAEAGSGAVTVVQLGGGTADGTVYVLNSGTNDVSTAIDSYVTAEIDGGGEILHLGEILLRAKVQSAGNIAVTPSLNSIAQTALSLSQTAEVTNQTIRRHRVNTNLTGQHISLKVQHNTVSESCQLLDMGVGLEVYEEQ